MLGFYRVTQNTGWPYFNEYLINKLRCCKKKNSMVEQPLTIQRKVMRYILILSIFQNIASKLLWEAEIEARTKI